MQSISAFKIKRGDSRNIPDLTIGCKLAKPELAIPWLLQKSISAGDEKQAKCLLKIGGVIKKQNSYKIGQMRTCEIRENYI